MRRQGTKKKSLWDREELKLCGERHHLQLLLPQAQLYWQLHQPRSFTPTKPQFGGLVQVSNNTQEAWVGGEPLSDWSGLKILKPKHVSAMQYRPTTVYVQQKQDSTLQKSRTEDKFSKGDNLLVFE